MVAAELPEGAEWEGHAALPLGGGPLSVPTDEGRQVEVPPASDARAPVHEAGDLPTVPRPGWQQCWDMLGPSTKQKLRDMADPLLEWWTAPGDDEDERPTVHAFGPHGLCRATPTSRDGKQVYLVERLRLDPNTMRQQSFHTQAPKGRSGAGRPAVDPPPRPESAPPLDLPAHTLGVLGNLPADVQDFLQRPFFQDDDRSVVADFSYEEGLEFTGQLLHIRFCLSADRNVTVAAGTRTVSRGRSADQARWEIECYHARVGTPSRRR